MTDRSGDAGKWSRRRFVEVFPTMRKLIFDLIYGVSQNIANTFSRTILAPGVDGVDNQEVEDMFAGVWGDEGEERAALEAEAGESRGPGRGVKGFG